MRDASGIAPFDLASAPQAASLSEAAELTLSELTRAYCETHQPLEV